MILEIHDTEEGNTLNGRVTLDYDYQAEMWVQQLAPEHLDCIRFVLLDDEGERAVWERPSLEAREVSLVRKAPRFTGEWRMDNPFRF